MAIFPLSNFCLKSVALDLTIYLALARALVNRPNIIIADEPTAALDKATADEIMEVMKSLNSIGKTIVIVTHDRTVAEKCRRIVELSDGEIILDKTIA